MTAPARFYPALDVSWPDGPDGRSVDLLLAALDDHQPSAVEPTPLGCRIFFNSSRDRDRARDVALGAAPDASVVTLEVSDEAWAERSQAGLEPVTVGALTIAPPWSAMPADANPRTWITIQPSMGFGTGHHQTTRLCLRLLQDARLDGVRVLDVGTGSGVLAIAAARLGAADVVAVDYDAHAIESARDNVARNGVDERVRLRSTGLGAVPEIEWDEPSLPAGGLDPSTRASLDTRATSGSTAADASGYDVVMANLTGATLLRLAAELAQSLALHGTLIVSGFQEFEREAVTSAFAAFGLAVAGDAVEDTWVGLALTRIVRGGSGLLSI